MAKYLLLFSVQESVGIPTEPDQDNRLGNQDYGNACRPASSGLKVPGETGHCRARTGQSW
jgi:hypothetical protein